MTKTSQLAIDEILGNANPTNNDPFTIATNTPDESEDKSEGVSLLELTSWSLRT